MCLYFFPINLYIYSYKFLRERYLSAIILTEDQQTKLCSITSSILFFKNTRVFLFIHMRNTNLSNNLNQALDIYFKTVKPPFSINNFKTCKYLTKQICSWCFCMAPTEITCFSGLITPILPCWDLFLNKTKIN